MVPPDESTTTTDAIAGFLQAIRSSRILSEQQFEKLAANIAKGGYPTELDELSSRLVKDGVLTQFQARQIQKGKPEGLKFGSYVILDFLGKGTTGKVYKARHRMMGRLVALKILDSRYVSNSTRSLARFQREMQLVGRLDHPNVVRAFDADRVADCHFIAMEYAAGSTLEALLRTKGALPPADVVYYASQAADGLAHAHARGVLHRDIKPSNLLLTEGQKLKILDFGLGTLLEREDVSTALTTAGMAVGTPDYISPEQARMVKLDGRSDLYSLGCTMYHLLSGQLPFKGESSMDCLVGRITGKAVPISEVRPGLPPRLVQSIEKLMATNPDDRYQTGDEAAESLRSMLRPKNTATAPPAPTVAAIASTPGPEPGHGPNEGTTAPAPVPKRDATLEAPAPLVRPAIRASEPKSGSLRSRGTGRWTKAKRVLAVAVTAVLVIGVTFLLFKSSHEGPRASQQGSLQPDNGSILAAAGADGHQSSLVIENSKNAAGREDVRQASLVIEKSKQRAAIKEEVRQSNPVIVSPKQGAAARADVRPPSLVIESPKPGATVGMREDLTGRIESGGWPVIFIQADIPGQPWWCQAPVAKIDGGRFSTQVVFGDESTPPGTRFRVAGIITRAREEALKFDIGSKQPALPQGFPQSVEVVVTHR
jgi:eukaryotic-like serine/threonine-protein kinase